MVAYYGVELPRDWIDELFGVREASDVVLVLSAPFSDYTVDDCQFVKAFRRMDGNKIDMLILEYTVDGSKSRFQAYISGDHIIAVTRRLDA